MKSKKSKSKRSVSTACWVQNDDGTLCLTIGPKKKITESETSGSELESSSPVADSPDVNPPTDINHNITTDIALKSPQPMIIKQNPFSPAKTIANVPNSPIKILKPNWSLQNGLSYRERQQIKRREEMVAE